MKSGLYVLSPGLLASVSLRSAERTELLPRPHRAEPRLVAEMRFREFTRDGHVRHPSFLGLREDKKPRDVVLDPRAGTALPG